jgi:hypothetical protein
MYVYAWLDVQAAHNRKNLPLPAYSGGDFALMDSRGIAKTLPHVFPQRSAPASSSPDVGIGDYYEAPFQPGESFTMRVVFALPSSDRALTLAYRPVPEDRRRAVLFKVR